MKTVNILFGVAAILSLSMASVGIAAEPSLGERIYPHCKVCHGNQGEGGKGGKYPRIAGLPPWYIEKQLNDFKTRKRSNKPMVPIFKNWRFNREVMAAMAEYVSQLPEAKPVAPAYEPDAELLAEFDSREEFDELGVDLYQGSCAQCHGDQGSGRADKEAPPLVNQYPAYIKRQMGDFASGRREHEHAEKMFGELDIEEVESLLVYLSKLDQP